MGGTNRPSVKRFKKQSDSSKKAQKAREHKGRKMKPYKRWPTSKRKWYKTSGSRISNNYRRCEKNAEVVCVFQCFLVEYLVNAWPRNLTCIFKSNQIYSSYTQCTKAKTYTVYSRCGAAGSCQRANAPLWATQWLETIRTESNATHEIKNYYRDTPGT